MKICFCFFVFSFSFFLSFAQNINGSFMYDGILRTYILHLPPGYNSSVPTPLVLNLHGLTSDAQQQLFYTGFNTEADAQGYIVVYPNGVGNSWNSGFNVPYHGGVDDVGFLSALIDTVSANYNIDACRVFSTGMSNGGFMSYRLACELENKIAAVASVTGSMTDSMMFYCQNSRPVSVMEIHGTADNIVAYNGSAAFTSVDQNFNFWKQRNNCPGTEQTVNMPDIDPLDGATVTKIFFPLCDDSTELITYKVNGGGHTWPGASLIIGVTTQDIKANVEILNFFNRNPLCKSVSLNENKHNTVLFFPNPAENFIRVKTGTREKFVLLIFDVHGKKFFEEINCYDNNSLEISNFPPGIYCAKIESQHGITFLKFVKQ